MMALETVVINFVVYVASVFVPSLLMGMLIDGEPSSMLLFIAFFNALAYISNLIPFWGLTLSILLIAFVYVQSIWGN